MLSQFEKIKPRYKKALSRTVSMMLVLVTLLGMMVIPASAASTNTAWPEVNAGQYIEMVVLQDKIPSWQDAAMTKRGNLSSSRVYDSYAAGGDILFVKDVIELGNKVACLASFPTASGRKDGWFSAKDLFGTWYPLGELTATAKVLTYTNAELSTRSGSIFADEGCWELGRTASRERLMLYPAQQGTRAYKAAWVSAADYEQHFTKKTNDDNKVIPVTGLSMSAVNAERLSVGETTTVNVVVSPKNATYNLTFSSSDVNVVTIDAKGVITAVGAGDAQVYAHAGNCKGILKVHVEAPPAPEPSNTTSAWPTLFASCYLEMVLPCEVPAYRDSQLSARGTAIPYKTYSTARGFKGDLVRIEYVDEQVTYFRYPVGSSYVYAYASTENIFGVTSPTYAKAQVKETSYVYPDFSRRSGSTAVGDLQYWCGRKGDFQLCIYTAVNGQRSYKAAFIHRPEQDLIPDDKVDPVPPQSDKLLHPDNGYHRIRYGGNASLYISVTSDGLNKADTQLQLLEEEASLGYQGCTFYLRRGKGADSDCYQIFTGSGMMVAVSGGSHDDKAAVVQTKEHSNDHGKWYIIQNDDGSVSFRNKASGKMLNVAGGGSSYEGCTLWQYHQDFTAAERFHLIRRTEDNVYTAHFTTNMQKALDWTAFRSTGTLGYTYKLDNKTPWTKTVNGVTYYPTPGQPPVLTNVWYISPEQALVLLKAEAYRDEIALAARERNLETAVEILSKIGIFALQGIGDAIECVVELDQRLRNAEWNNMIDHIRLGLDGHTGVLIYAYATISEQVSHEAVYGSVPNCRRTTITCQTTYSYVSFDGDGLADKFQAVTARFPGDTAYSFT